MKNPHPSGGFFLDILNYKIAENWGFSPKIAHQLRSSPELYIYIYTTGAETENSAVNFPKNQDHQCRKISLPVLSGQSKSPQKKHLEEMTKSEVNKIGDNSVNLWLYVGACSPVSQDLCYIPLLALAVGKFEQQIQADVQCAIVYPIKQVLVRAQSEAPRWSW